jgi:periplasmic protein TonB
MFGELLESRARPVRNRAGTIVSIFGHGMFIALAVVATRTQLIADGPDERIFPLPVLNPPPPVATARPTQVQQPSPSRRFENLAPPTQHFIDVSVPVIPLLDGVSQPAVAIDWSSDRPGLPVGITTRQGVGTDDGIPFASGVDKPALALANNPAPRYPDVLRRANIGGEVVVQVVIDTTGRADLTTARVLSSNNPAFTEAVLSALPRARYVAAESGGRKVRMWVVQSFVFTIER